LLSDKGLNIKNIISILGINRQAIVLIINKWEELGLIGLFDKKRKGRPKILSPAQKNKVIEFVEHTPRSLKAVVAEIEKQFDVKVGLSVIKILCKRSGLV
jgi:transposase